MGIYNMKNLQKVIEVDTCKNLYNLIAAMGDARAEGAESVMLWSQGSSSKVLQNVDELELVERYVRKFGLKVTLSAANDPTLRRMASQLGWKVLWQVPDTVLEREPIQPEISQWLFRREQTGWQAAG
jgi:hypothetical protein